ncbi:hypothetical protein HHK36_022604 [Tetracentron sinense]|uniref:K Homology domain-containing protein n=1 Tax=Tetracentron sinense TaxID=13715 RepID=A0A834YPW4_TETSI|nr:hypothetical protein HHK36_022604 [Tetracentron sinense]
MACSVQHFMAEHGENFGEHDISGMPGNSHPQQKGHDDSGVQDDEKRWPGWPGESVFRMLVPAQKVGGIIGRKGEFIKRMCEETRARIKILDGPPGTSERADQDSFSLSDARAAQSCSCVHLGCCICVQDIRQWVLPLTYCYLLLFQKVMISAKEELDVSVPPAMDGLLRVHKRIVDGLDGDSPRAPPGAGTVSTRLLVAATQAGSLIGKQGSTIKSIQETSNCIIRVLGPEDLPVFAMQDDRVVEIQGEPTGVHKGVELIASHLRKFLVDRSVVAVFEMHNFSQMQMPNPQMERDMPPHQSWGHPQVFTPNAGGGPGFGNNRQYMPPPRQNDNHYPPADLPPLDRQPHQGLSVYGRDASMGVHASTNAQPPQSLVTQVTQQMQIPLSYADAVIGTAGSNISYIRRASGSTITIQETRGMPGEMTVEINGTASQVQIAQQLIQNFMAEAAGSTQHPTGGSSNQGYNSFQAHGSTYASPPSNTVHAGHTTGGYGSAYGTNYGY